jgi:O-methyltransferase
VFDWRTRQKVKRLVAEQGLVLLNHRDPERRAIMQRIAKVKRETDLGIDYIEGLQLTMAVERTRKVPGELAEVGVYRGGSAKLILLASDGRPLHLFDTFQGIPAVEAIDAPHFKPGAWKGSLEQVQSYLAGHDNLHFHVGFFPDTAGPIADTRFAFVNLDVDTHQSTKDALNVFYPRMSPGGVILSHDYGWAEGVKKAFDDFFADKPEPVLRLSGSQCLVVKVAAG